MSKRTMGIHWPIIKIIIKKKRTTHGSSEVECKTNSEEIRQ
jgi:hypothetical protein